MPINPIATSESEQFIVGKSDFSFFGEYPVRNEGGALLFCIDGNADATVNQCRGRIERNAMILLLPGSLLMLESRSDDFRIMFCAFSRELFSEAGYRLEPSFFRFLMEKPITYPDDQRAEGIRAWLQMAVYTYNDKDNIFRNTIIKNRLQNIFLEIYDKQQRFTGVKYPDSESSTRQSELFTGFITLVHEHCSRDREVSFYADKLCISTRYLSTIVRSMAQASAKELIDRLVMVEIKMLLQSTDLSVQEIAYRLHFPDQSYLGRYFKKHAGVSPTDFRNKK